MSNRTKARPASRRATTRRGVAGRLDADGFELTGRTSLGRQTHPGTARQQARARKAKRTRSRRVVIGRVAWVLVALGVAGGVVAGRTSQPTAAALCIAVTAAGILVLVNTPTRRRKRGRR